MRNVPTISGHQIGQSCFGRRKKGGKGKRRSRRVGRRAGGQREDRGREGFEGGGEEKRKS